MASGTATLERVDFFVHPDFHRFSGAWIYDSVHEYEEALRRQIDDSVLPVLIYNNDGAAASGDFWDRFDASNRFASKLNLGFVDPKYDQVDQLNDLLEDNGITEAVVHGSYFQLCVAGFMSALGAAYTTRQLHYNSRAESHIGDVPSANVVHGQILNHSGWIDHTLSPYGIRFADDAIIYHTNGRPSRGKRDLYHAFS